MILVYRGCQTDVDDYLVALFNDFTCCTSKGEGCFEGEVTDYHYSYSDYSDTTAYKVCCCKGDM